MALGIGYLHSQNIIYRYTIFNSLSDLKPENILLDQDGHLKLADFGLSKVVYSNQDRVYTMCGTPEYIAPEVLIACNEPNLSVEQGYDKVCDWWSYGCLLYEMFTGYPPFYSKDKKQMLKNRM
jgi:serine/threonine protein kinase